MTSKSNISETISYSIINNTIFGNRATRIFRCMYVNCFDRLRFLAEVSTKFQKMPLFRQFKDHKSGSKQGKWRNDSIFFSSIFSALTVFIIHFWIWKYSKFIFMWSPLWYILVCKIPQFLAKIYQFGQLIILF